MQELVLADDGATALEQITEASRAAPVVIFKRSPICPISQRAENEFDAWLAELAPDAALHVARVNVIQRKPLARGLTAALGIEHESPQALWFQAGALAWHDSHGALTADRFRTAFTGR